MPSDLIARGLGATLADLVVPSSSGWRAFVRDANCNVIDEIDQWDHFVLNPRHNAVGTFTLTMPSDVTMARLMGRGYGIVVLLDDVTQFNGRIFAQTRTARTLTMSGKSDEYILERPCLPTPQGPPYTDAYDTITGVASTVMRQLVWNNTGLPYCRADREVSNLTIAPDPLLGVSSVTARARFDPIIAQLQNIASTPQAGGLGFRIVQPSIYTNSLFFEVFQPTDKSLDAVFSIDRETATDFEDAWSAPAANYFFVGGGDGLDDRTVLEDGDADSIAEVGRIEAFSDARGVTDTGELNQRLAELVAGAVSARQVTITPLASLNGTPLEYGDDYRLGDLVTFEVDGTPFTDIMRAVEIDLTTDRGVVITPTVGTESSSTDSLAQQYIASLQDRIGNVERNWGIPDASIIAAMLAAEDVPAHHEVVGYDSGTGQFQWLNLGEITGGGIFPTLTVTGNTTLGDGSGGDTLTVGATSTFNGSVTIQSLATVLAVFDVTAGLARIGSASTPGFYHDVSNSRTLVGTATALSGASNDRFSVAGGTSYFAGPSGPAIGIRYNAAQTVGWLIGVAGAGADQNLNLVDDGGSTVAYAGDLSSAYQWTVVGNLSVAKIDASDRISATKVVIDGTTFSGSEKLRVVSGSSRLEGAVTVTSGGIGVTGSSVFNSGLSVLGGLTVTTGGAEVNGLLTAKDGLVVTASGAQISAGGLSVTGSSVFNSGLSVAGGLTVTTGSVAFPNTFLGFFGGGGNAKQTVSGSRGGNAALASLLTALASGYGLVTDSSTP